MQGRKNQRAASKRACPADGGDGDIDALAGPGKRWQIGSDQHGGGVFEAGVDAGGQGDAEARGDAAHPLRQIFETVVTGAGETDDDAVADELVGADAFECAEVFDARLLGEGGSGEEEGCECCDEPQ